MQKIQIVMWPTNSKEQDFGRPCGRDVIPMSQSFTVEEVQEKAMVHMRTNLLPNYLFDLARQGIDAGIGDIEDIVTVVEAFRWMSWCHVTMQVMRIPLTTILLRKLISAAEGLKMSDEKLLRFFRNLNTRAIAWKSKARKLIYGTNLQIDTPRLNGLLLEGNQIPISSRIKDILRAAMERIIAATKPAYGEENFVLPAIDPDVALATTSTTAVAAQPKRPHKGSSLVSGSGVGAPMYASLSQEPPDSTDEEKRQSTGGLSHVRLSQHVISPAPKVWPPIIPFQRSNGQTPTVPPPQQPVYGEPTSYDDSGMVIGDVPLFADLPPPIVDQPTKRGRKPKVRS
jgi:hypothetical protein